MFTPQSFFDSFNDISSLPTSTKVSHVSKLMIEKKNIMIKVISAQAMREQFIKLGYGYQVNH